MSYAGKHNFNTYIKQIEGNKYETQFLQNEPIISTLFDLVIKIHEEVLIKTKDGKDWRLKYSAENQRMELIGKPFDDSLFIWGNGWVDCVRCLSHLDIENYQVDMKTAKHTNPVPSRESVLARRNYQLQKEISTKFYDLRAWKMADRENMRKDMDEAYRAMDDAYRVLADGEDGCISEAMALLEDKGARRADDAFASRERDT